MRRASLATRARRGAFALAAAALLAACVAAPPREDAPVADDVSIEARCTRALARLDAAVDAEGTNDASAARVPGFAYVRATRLIASYGDEAAGDERAFAHWLALLIAEDGRARRIELLNLPRARREALLQALAAQGFADFDDALARCPHTLAARDLASREGREQLVRAARVPDDYDVALRALGLYPLTKIAFALGIRIYERTVYRAFGRADAQVRGVLARYEPDVTPLPSNALQAFIARELAHPLRMPAQARDVDLRALLATHAPVFVVDEADDDDRIGAPRWTPQGRIDIHPEPIVYGRLTHTRFDGDTHVQLVYTAWFGARRPSWPGDPRAGPLDAVVWRVTLDRDGAPLVYDSIHACGCYHLFVPTSRVALRAARRSLEEQAVVPATLPIPAPGERIEIRIESGSHYVRDVRSARVPIARPPARGYAIAPEDTLALLRGHDREIRSMFGPDGFVPGTERAEQALLWPLGIPRAGAMRQWGRRPTAFIGRRHFDEPFLLDRYFVRAPG